MRLLLLTVVWLGVQAASGMRSVEVHAQGELPDPPKPAVGELPDPPKPAIGELPEPPKPAVRKLPDPPNPTVIERPAVRDQPHAVLIEELPSDVLPPPTLTSGFGIPEGLKTAPEILLPSLGYGPAHCFPLTPTTCFDVGYKCYTYGLYQDALAFANHGLQQCNHARIYLLKAMCEMHLGRCDDARVTLVKYRHASLRPQESVGLAVAREKLNDPMRARLKILLAAWNEVY
ncbi:MAG: hypothetical protein AABP62_20190 [Planctomycetota bacterium]